MFTSEDLRKIVNGAKPENVVITDSVQYGERKTYINNGNVRLILSAAEYNNGTPTTYLEYEIMEWGKPYASSRQTYHIEGVSYEKEIFPILKKKDEERIKDIEELIRDIFMEESVV